MRWIKYVSLIITTIFTASCATVMNPYQGDFNCPYTDPGKCVSLRQAYDESIGVQTTEHKSLKKKGSYIEDEEEENAVSFQAQGEKTEKQLQAKEPSTTEDQYTDALYKRIAGLLQEPATPIVAPPQVIRVLVLPYKGDGKELYMGRYIYIMVEGPQWVVGEYLEPKAKE